MSQILDPIFDGFDVVTPPKDGVDYHRATDSRFRSAPPSLARRAAHALGAPASGLSPAHRAEARQVVALGAYYLLSRPGPVHYTQGGQRWEAITERHVLEFSVYRGSVHSAAAHHVIPFHSDCSGTDSWLLWLALHHFFAERRHGRGVRDVVNGTNWVGGGYTGTMVKHGKPVRFERNWRLGDQVFYGGTPDVPEHVATLLGKRAGKWVVFTHGSEGGPYLAPVDYRPDRRQVRRFI